MKTPTLETTIKEYDEESFSPHGEMENANGQRSAISKNNEGLLIRDRVYPKETRSKHSM